MRRRWISIAAALVGLGALAAAALTANAGVTRAVVSPASCAFDLKIGDVLPFTGDLAAYGGNMDRAVKLAVDLENKSLAAAGMTGAKVEVVGSEDGQTQASASVEAATKLIKTQGANVIIGEMASGATIPMAQSVTIPDGIVTLSPTASAPQISTIKDHNLLWRLYPSDSLQGKVLAQAAASAFNKGVLNIGARNDAFGTALAALVKKQYVALGGKVGKTVLWNPNQANFDTEAGQLVSGSPAGWVIIDFPDTFQKFAPSLVRTGQWDPKKTFMTEALRNGDVLKAIGSPVDGLRGTAASSAGGPAGKGVRRALEDAGARREALHRLRGHGLRRVDGGVPRGGQGLLGLRREAEGEPDPGLGAAGDQGHVPEPHDGGQGAPRGQGHRL